MLRIEWGVPRFGREITQERNPLEAGLDAGISFTKGCYIGQEVVARLESRQKVSRQLVGLWLEPGPAPSEGSPIEAADRPGLVIGTLTSAAPSLDFRRLLGLGFVGTERSAPGARLEVISDGDRVGAVVASLPFRSSEIPEPGRAAR
jgi:folate-binding protein YgfZ